MKQVILDTNVGLVAVGAYEKDGGVPTAKLKAWCVELIAKIKRKEIVLVIDSEREIVGEYLNKLPRFPLGDEFIKWLTVNMWTESTVKRVAIKKTRSGYEEFPDDANLKEFDSSDRKFVAVAVANKGVAPIQEATDGKWWKWAKSLKKYDVMVEFGDETFAKDLCHKKNNCNGECKDCHG